MQFKICLFAPYHRHEAQIKLLEWFSGLVYAHQFIITKTIDETITHKPNLVIIILCRLGLPYEGRHVDIRTMAGLNHMNVIICRLNTPAYYVMPNSLLDDQLDYTKLASRFVVFPNHIYRYVDEERSLNHSYNFLLEMLDHAFDDISKRWLTIYLMVGLNCNVMIAQTIIHHLPKN